MRTLIGVAVTTDKLICSDWCKYCSKKGENKKALVDPNCLSYFGFYAFVLKTSLENVLQQNERVNEERGWYGNWENVTPSKIRRDVSGWAGEGKRKKNSGESGEYEKKMIFFRY